MSLNIYEYDFARLDSVEASLSGCDRASALKQLFERITRPGFRLRQVVRHDGFSATGDAPYHRRPADASRRFDGVRSLDASLARRRALRSRRPCRGRSGAGQRLSGPPGPACLPCGGRGAMGRPMALYRRQCRFSSGLGSHGAPRASQRRGAGQGPLFNRPLAGLRMAIRQSLSPNQSRAGPARRRCLFLRGNVVDFLPVLWPRDPAKSVLGDASASPGAYLLLQGRPCEKWQQDRDYGWGACTSETVRRSPRCR